MKSGCIAIIPARSGSKRIINKNIKIFNHKPMIYWTIKALRKTNLFKHIFISTDSFKYAELVKKYDVLSPFLRSKKLSDDMTATLPVIQDAIKAILTMGYDFEYVCCAYPCSPFILDKDIKTTLKVLKKSKKNFAYQVTNFTHPPLRGMLRFNDGTVKYRFQKISNNGKARSQDLDELFHDVGQFYWGRKKSWLEGKNLHTESVTRVIPSWRVVDIDTKDDWLRAEQYFKIFNKINANKY